MQGRSDGWVRVQLIINNHILIHMNPDDLRMGTIIKDGSDGNVVVVGVPYSYARKRCINKSGQELGPCCLRRFFGRVGPIVNPQHGISIEKLNVTDYGNIGFKEDNNNPNAAEECIEKITSQLQSLLHKGGIPFVFGGSKQSLLGSACAFHSRYGPNTQHILISGKPNLKKPLQNYKITSQNALTILTARFPNTITLFSAHQQHFPPNYPAHLFRNVPYHWIREQSYAQTPTTYTQAGSVFNSLLEEAEGPVHVSLTVEAIERFRGCRDVLSSGLTPEEIIEIFFLLGRSEKVKLVDISEFNPSVQDYESSLLLANLLYYFLLGFTSRPSVP